MEQLRENARQALHLDDYLRIDQRKLSIMLSERVFKAHAGDFCRDGRTRSGGGGRKKSVGPLAVGHREQGADTEEGDVYDVIEWLLEVIVDGSEKRRAVMKVYCTNQFSVQYLPPRVESNMLRGYFK